MSAVVYVLPCGLIRIGWIGIIGIDSRRKRGGFMISNTLLDSLIDFRREGDWEQFHTVRNLSSALCVETAELLDLFRWSRDSEITTIVEELG